MTVEFILNQLLHNNANLVLLDSERYRAFTDPYVIKKYAKFTTQLMLKSDGMPKIKVHVVSGNPRSKAHCQCEIAVIRYPYTVHNMYSMYGLSFAFWRYYTSPSMH